jgi:two-component system, chemotaxis family, sensor kinase CheA
MNEQELLKKLRAAFKTEAEERLTSLSSCLLELEKEIGLNEREAALEVVFREAHSLKGASRAVNLTDIEALCQSMESVFGAMKRDDLQQSPRLFDTLHEAAGVIEKILVTVSDDDRSSSQELIDPLIDRLESLRTAEKGSEADAPAKPLAAPTPPAASEPLTAPEAPATPEAPAQTSSAPARMTQSKTVRIASDKLDSLFLKAEELVSLKMMAAENLENMRNTMRLFEKWKERREQVDGQIRELRRSAGNGQGALSGVLEFLDWTHEHLHTLGGELRKTIGADSENQYSLGRMVDDLLDDMKNVTMLPFLTLLEVLPKMVRDLSRSQGKDVDFEIRGSEIEIDKRILEEMKDPLIHILRNAVDHGLETPDRREASGKPRRGSIELTVTQAEGSKVEILIADNGQGIDAEKVRDEASDRGAISPEDAESLDGLEMMSLIFRSGVSTSPTVTSISGRGLGLAIVQEKVEKLGGLLSVESEAGAGTTFRIHLPVTLATFRGILIRVGESEFIVPSAHVDRLIKIETDAVRTVESRETIPLDGRVLSLVGISDVLGIPEGSREAADSVSQTVIVLGSGDRRIAFKVDEVLCEQEVLVKSLGRQLERVRNIAGATIMGSGRLALILNVNDLLNSATRSSRSALGLPAVAGERETGGKSVLVAEDSITSRMLLKNILESAGYSVTTAVDGLDAFTTLQAGEFDLVVSDVEMPRMNGFELTSRIRDDKQYAETPVVLVTALKSSEDRERGIDAGASAYIVKSNFDQSNLLDTLRRLL